ncbi:MAG: TrmH family RNA methyltransferase [Caulobacteraceae bacterium]
MLIPIDDPADPRVEPFLAVRERDLVGRQGRFVAEGEVVLAAAAGKGLLEALLIDHKRVEGLGPILRRLEEAIPVYAASQGVLDAIVGFHIHRGILGIGRRPAEVAAGALLAGLPQRAVVLALFGIGNHDNMGGLFRNAAAFGAGAVLLARDCCDPLYRKAIRVSVGAALTIPFACFGADEDPVSVLEAAGFEPLALSPAGRERLSALAPPARAAVLLGAEGPGLSAELMARTRTVRIPMSPGWDSLNVAVAGAIALHHLTGVDG